MIVKQDAVREVLHKISLEERVALDTETSGLHIYGPDRILSLIIASPSEVYYFNFNDTPDHLGQVISGTSLLSLDLINPIVQACKGVVFIHNARFDISVLEKYGANLDSTKIFCTQAISRVDCNVRASVSLANMAKVVGEEKSKELDKYISKHKLYEWIHVPGKTRKKNAFYDQVPLEIMQPYAEMDAKVTLKLGEYLISNIRKQDRIIPVGRPKLEQVKKNELDLIMPINRMERRGILTDPEYIQKAYEHECAIYHEAMGEFQEKTGVAFVDSNKVFSEVFDGLGVKYPRTEKGNPSFKDEALVKMDHPITDIIKKYRKAHKKANTYYRNFLDMAVNNVLHCRFMASGARTGRLSCTTPNLQNVPKRGEDKSLFPVRRCFIPRPGLPLVMIDYDAMEYKLLMDYAGEMAVIKKVLEGYDVHQATADMLGKTRDQAKTINFALLYGMGQDALAKKLKCSVDEAKDIKEQYFDRLPNIAKLISEVTYRAESRGFIFNWFGRRYYFTRNECYKAPNYLIQGGCADIMKRAMIQIDKLLADKNTNMLLQVHDEIVFEFDQNEMDLVPQIKKIMGGVFPSRHLPLTASADISNQSWHDKVPLP